MDIVQYEMVCPNDDCGNKTRFVEDVSQGDIACPMCGAIVQGRVINEQAEWRTFADSDEPDKSRVSTANPFLKDAAGTTIGATSGAAREMLKWQGRMVSASDRNLQNAFHRITTLADQLHLPSSVKHESQSIYAQFEERRPRSMRHRSDSIIVAVLFLACKEQNLPRTFRDLAYPLSIDEGEIKKAHKQIVRLLGRHETRTNAKDLLGRYCNALSLPFQLQRRAEQVADQAMNLIEGKTPASIAGSSLLMALRLTNDTTKKVADIATVTNITAGTIHNVFRQLAVYVRAILAAIPEWQVSSSIVAAIESEGRAGVGAVTSLMGDAISADARPGSAATASVRGPTSSSAAAAAVQASAPTPMPTTVPIVTALAGTMTQ